MPPLKEKFLRILGKSAFPSMEELKKIYKNSNPDMTWENFLKIIEDKYASTYASPENMRQLKKEYEVAKATAKENSETLSWNDFMKYIIISRLMYPSKASHQTHQTHQPYMYHGPYHGGRKSRPATRRRKSRPATRRRRSTRRKSRSTSKRANRTLRRKRDEAA